jgi:hypothetical protein
MPDDANKLTVFVSYSWDGEEHKHWVKRLADAIDAEPDLDVTFDQYDMFGGKDLTQFMERGLGCERVVVISTPEYVRKATQRLGGVGYECSLITADLVRDMAQDKFIPALCAGDAVPPFLQTKLRVDFRDPDKYETELAKLLAAIRRHPLAGRPIKRAMPSSLLDAHEPATDALPNHRPKIRLILAVPRTKRPIKTETDKRDFISGLTLPFITVRNNGPEEAFRIQLTLPETRGVNITVKQIDNLSPGESVTFQHHDLKYSRQGERQVNQNFWMFLFSLNMPLPAEHPKRVAYPLPIHVEYVDPRGKTFLTRYELTGSDHGHNLNFISDESL